MNNSEKMKRQWQNPKFKQKMLKGIKEWGFRKGHKPYNNKLDEWREKGGTVWNKGVKGIHLAPTTEFKKGMIPWNKGKEYIAIKGDKHPNWHGGKSFEPYTLEWTKKLRLEIRKRDNFTCQLCGITEEESLKKYKRVLAVNHIDFDKSNCDSSNLNALCVSCNALINFDRDKWTNYFKSKRSK